jgi:hypothetical protein
MAYQVIANSDKFILGSADLKIGTSIATLASVGSLQGIKFSSDGAASDIEFDNASAITKKSLKGCMVEANSSEIDVSMLKTIFGSSDDVYATVAGSLVPAYAQTVASGDWSFNKFIAFSKQNGDGTAISLTSVVGSVDGALVLDTDFVKSQNPTTGEYGISVVDSATVTSTGQALVLTYAYTPSVAKTLTVMAGNFVPTAFVARLTHTNDAGKIFQITINKCYSTEFMQFPFSQDGGTDVMRMPIKIKGVSDANSVAYEIFDSRVY